MNRFQLTKKPPRIRVRLFLQILLFVLIVCFLVRSVSMIKSTTEKDQMDSLQRAIRRSAVQCYALEGFYPESLDYLKEHYGISWNEKKYVVDYEIMGSNLMPDIHIFPLKQAGTKQVKLADPSAQSVQREAIG